MQYVFPLLHPITQLICRIFKKQLLLLVGHYKCSWLTGTKTIVYFSERIYIGQWCFQSTHPLTLLKSGTVTVSKRKSYEYVRWLWYLCTETLFRYGYC